MRIAILSDIHEDYQNLKKILRKSIKAGFDRLVCLGDISGYSVPYYKYFESRDAHGCLSLLREQDAVIIPGNHDFYAAKRIPEVSAGFVYPENWYALDYRLRKEVSMGKIWLHEERDLDPLYTIEDIEYLQSLAEYYIFNDAEPHLFFSHYVYPNLSGFQKGFYTSAKEFIQHFDFMDQHGCRIGFTGHAHVRGYYAVTPFHFKHYPYGSHKIKSTSIIFGVPPVTSHKKRSGFCIFDTEKLNFRAIRL